MTGPAHYDDAEGVILRFPARITRDEAREIGVQFPGWHVWYGAWSETWNAHREGEEPYLGPGTVAGRASMVSAHDATGLVALLENQVRVDIAAEFPNWRVKQSPGGWCAVCRQWPRSRDGAVVQLVYCPALGGLLRALRARCAGQVIGHGA